MTHENRVYDWAQICLPPVTVNHVVDKFAVVWFSVFINECNSLSDLQKASIQLVITVIKPKTESKYHVHYIKESPKVGILCLFYC